MLRAVLTDSALVANVWKVFSAFGDGEFVGAALKLYSHFFARLRSKFEFTEMFTFKNRETVQPVMHRRDYHRTFVEFFPHDS